MIKKNTYKRSDAIVFCILFLITLLLSRINFPLIGTDGIMPDYFLALFVSLIATRLMKINIYILFLLGLLIDLLAGELIGQYGLVLIIIYFVNFILNKYFLLQTTLMQFSQNLILITIGLIMLLILSSSYELTTNVNLLGIKWIVTCLVCLLYNQIIKASRHRI
jgi:rod shape-determining protein MreD